MQNFRFYETYNICCFSLFLKHESASLSYRLHRYRKALTFFILSFTLPMTFVFFCRSINIPFMFKIVITTLNHKYQAIHQITSKSITLVMLLEFQRSFYFQEIPPACQNDFTREGGGREELPIFILSSVFLFKSQGFGWRFLIVSLHTSSPLHPAEFNIKIHIFNKQLLLNLICTVFSCSTGVLNAAALCRSLSMINPTAGCLLHTDLLKMFQYMSHESRSITHLSCHFSMIGTQVSHFLNHLCANSILNLY